MTDRAERLANRLLAIVFYDAQSLKLRGIPFTAVLSLGEELHLCGDLVKTTGLVFLVEEAREQEAFEWYCDLDAALYTVEFEPPGAYDLGTLGHGGGIGLFIPDEALTWLMWPECKVSIGRRIIAKHAADCSRLGVAWESDITDAPSPVVQHYTILVDGKPTFIVAVPEDLGSGWVPMVGIGRQHEETAWRQASAGEVRLWKKEMLCAWEGEQNDVEAEEERQEEKETRGAQVVPLAPRRGPAASDADGE